MFAFLFLRAGIDKPPFQVTETGWGEFDVQIKIIFVPESGEKPLTTYHRLKLHPWHPVAIRAPESVSAIDPAAGTWVAETASEELTRIDEQQETPEVVAELSTAGESEANMDVDVKREDEQPSMTTTAQTPMEAAAAGSLTTKHPPVVHSWSYDEIVFPEPTEAFYEILLANPPTP